MNRNQFFVAALGLTALWIGVACGMEGSLTTMENTAPLEGESQAKSPSKEEMEAWYEQLSSEEKRWADLFYLSPGMYLKECDTQNTVAAQEGIGAVFWEASEKSGPFVHIFCAKGMCNVYKVYEKELFTLIPLVDVHMQNPKGESARGQLNFLIQLLQAACSYDQALELAKLRDRIEVAAAQSVACTAVEGESVVPSSALVAPKQHKPKSQKSKQIRGSKAKKQVRFAE